MTSSLNDLAYAHICQLLVENRIVPNQRLSEQNLAQDLGISRTPVREAIRRLRSEGILQQIPSSGTYLLAPGYDEIKELYEVREALECYLINKAVPSMTHRDFKRIRENYREMKKAVDRMKAAADPYLTGEPLQRFLKADWAFHRHLLESADNRHALKILDDALLKGCVFGISSHRRDLTHLDRVLILHRRIAMAVFKGNAAAAVHWLRMHIRESRRDALAAIREMKNTSPDAQETHSAYDAIMNTNADK